MRIVPPPSVGLRWRSLAVAVIIVNFSHSFVSDVHRALEGCYLRAIPGISLLNALVNGCLLISVLCLTACLDFRMAAVIVTSPIP